MVERGNYDFAKEAKVLEYWRKRYLGQAFVVAILAVAVAVFSCFYADFFIARLFLCLLSFVVFYVMCKSLRSSLQVRGEGLVLSQCADNFLEVTFDVGRGLCENALLAQEIVKNYQVRECDNVMRGKGYYLEEDWFYTIVSSKFISVNKTEFQGVVLAFACLNGNNNDKGEVFIEGNKPVLKGEAAKYLEKNDGLSVVIAFLKLLKANSAQLSIMDNTFYVWIKTEKKLFYQFSLVQRNSIKAFCKRLEYLEELSLKMLKALND